MRELWPNEKVAFNMMQIARKRKVYRPVDFLNAISPDTLGLKTYEVRSHINNQIQRFTKLGVFKKVAFGEYRLMVSRKNWETIAKEIYQLNEPEVKPEVKIKESIIKMTNLEVTQADKIVELEHKVNILSAAFISIGLKLQNSTDIHKILTEISQKIESIMS